MSRADFVRVAFAASLADHARSARSAANVTPQVPSEAERADYRAWVLDMARGQPLRSPPAGFRALPTETEHVVVLREEPDAKHGAGLLALRREGSQPILVEAPHTFFEQGTLPLALMAFERLNARALVLNTIHRGGVSKDRGRKRRARSGKSPCDTAHNPHLLFSVAHDALVAADRSALTIQLHGFDGHQAPDADVVVSAARSSASPQPVAAALRAVVGANRVRIYPDDVAVLGGTTNVQARISRAVGAPFLHLELSKSLRERLRADPALAQQFVDALAKGIRA
jgi:hypothetical protein